MSRPQTLTEKILSRGAGRKVYAGEYVWLEFDATLTTDISAPITIRLIEDLGVEKLVRRDRIYAFTDHFGAPPGIKEANTIAMLRRFCRSRGVENFFDIGRSGVCHAHMLEERLVRPGELLAGTDSHTCSSGAVGAFATGIGSTELAALWVLGRMWLPVPESIRVELEGELKDEAQAKDAVLTLVGALGARGALQYALEFGGPALRALSMRERFTLCNMAVEMGATNAVCEVDETTVEWFRDRGRTEVVAPDRGASYRKVIRLDLSSVVPMVAKPYSPDNVEAAAALESVKVDQVYVGSCTNGSFDDICSFAASLRRFGPKVHPEVRAIVVPSSQSALAELLRAGVVDELQEAGCQIMPPGCGACIGTHWGVLGDGEVGFFTSNRNFRGRTGSPEASTYLGSPHLAGIVAARGRIEHGVGGGSMARPAVRVETEVQSGRGAEPPLPMDEVPREGGGSPVPALAVKRDNINTDEIIPARYCNTIIPEELAPHALEDYDPTLAARIEPGAVLVGGENFGCGSSREVAAVTLAAAGVGAIVAKSFGAIFERNCINNALPVFRSPTASERIEEGDSLLVYPARGEIINVTKNEKYRFPPLGGAAADVMKAGSLSRYIEINLSQRRVD